MSTDKAKEFLVALADDEDASAQVETAYIAALRDAAAGLGYQLDPDDIAAALDDVLGADDDLQEVSGFSRSGLLDSVALLPVRPTSFGNPLGFASRHLPTRPPRPGSLGPGSPGR